MSYTEERDKVLKSFGNRLGVLRKAISQTNDGRLRRPEAYLARVYKTKSSDPSFKLINEIHNHDLKLLKFYFTECKDGKGGHDMKKFEVEVEKRITIGEYPYEGDV